MASDAGVKDLVYVTDVGTEDVYVYSYPEGKYVGTLTGFNSPVRDCSDASGNVYITNTDSQEILEYGHAHTKPKTTYRDHGYLPVDCSVDPTTGTLAVANYGPYSKSNTGSIAIYADGKAQRKFYRDPSVQAYLFCTYDGSGNLFVDGLDAKYNFVVIELPKGATAFEPISLNESFAGWGGVKWDGTYLAISDGASAIYDYAVKGTKAKKVHTVQLKQAVNVLQFWIDGSTVIAPDGPNGANHDAGFWNYPKGGAPTKTIGTGLFVNPSSATVSVAGPGALVRDRR